MSRRNLWRTGRREERRPIPVWLTVAVTAVAFGVIAWTEKHSPARQRREDQMVRTARNVTMAGLSSVAVSLTQNILMGPSWKRSVARKGGLLSVLRLPRSVETLLAVLLLDYTLWWWHWINHKWPVLWRFHLVHHVDRDLDASTAVRFHFGEMSLSVLYRIAQLRLIGPDRYSVSLWQTLLLVSILFHHSAIRFSEGVDRALAGWIVSPRMHEIHHSDYLRETDSNWSSLFSVWDRLHRTFRHDVPSKEIRIGVPAYQDPRDVKLVRLVKMPFVEQRNDWIDPCGELKVHRASQMKE